MIYFDNAATTYPKPEVVYAALDNANRHLAFNAGRGEYKESSSAFDLIEDTRRKLGSFINCSSKVIFTSSATESFNMIINGIGIKSGDFVYISPFEHNAVVRTLYNLKKYVDFEIKVLSYEKGSWKPNLKLIFNEFTLYKPRAVFISHISNVTGYEVPYVEIFKESAKYDSTNVLDCAQSLGVLNPTKLSDVSYIVFAGHKSLYASFGIAGFLKLKNDVLNVTKAGGTGSDSLNYEMPDVIPYRFEAGSPNIVSIAGLNKSIDWLMNTDVKKRENELYNYLLARVLKNKNIIVYKPKNIGTFGILSINLNGYNANDLATVLYDDYDICVRAGYHCAPLVHDFIGSKPFSGTVRISLNYFNTIEEISVLCDALEVLSNEP